MVCGVFGLKLNVYGLNEFLYVLYVKKFIVVVVDVIVIVC